MKLDRIALGIFRSLHTEKQSGKEIAKSLSVSENTVRSRINSMIDEGVLKIIGLVDPYKLPGHQIAFVCIKLKPSDVFAASESLSKLKGVVSVNIVTGRFDLILEVLLSEDFGFLDFVKSAEDNLEKIISAETFIVWKTYNKMVPYIL